MLTFNHALPVVIGSDHAGVECKTYLKDFLTRQGLLVKDFGANTTDSVDYPDYAHPVATAVEEKNAAFGVLICGSANGVAITANKHQGIRAALCWKNEIAVLARKHNDANILCLPARFISNEEAVEMLQTFMNTAFEGGRHQNRVDKIACK